MYFSAALMLANGHLDDLFAEANRERLADQVRRSGRPEAHRSAVEWLRASSHRVGRVVRALPRVAAG